MPIHHIHSFLVHPGKGVKAGAALPGVSVPQKGGLFKMLSAVYDRADTENDIAILFNPDATGARRNARRTQLLQYISDPSIQNARILAEALQSSTTERSGLGLFFLMVGLDSATKKVLLARFAADQGVIADEGRGGLKIEFIERVFMKSAKAYKSVVYTHKSTSEKGEGFWEGRAVDKQIDGPLETAKYWIEDFLLSSLATTPAAGTKRLAVAIREAVRVATKLDTKTELVLAARLLRGKKSAMMSAETVIADFGLSDDAAELIKSAFPRSEFFSEAFQFDRTEFAKQAPFSSVELDNGAVLVADTESFEEVFVKESAGRGDGRVRYSTEGRVVREEIRYSK